MAQKIEDCVSAYLRKAFEPDKQARIIRAFSEAVKGKVFGRFDAIAVRGVSGMLFGPILAHLHKKRLVVVRKPNENSHTARIVEGFVGDARYVIVDDFVVSGTTCGIIEATINGHTFGKATLAGVFLYAAEYDRTSDLECCVNVTRSRWSGVPVVRPTWDRRRKPTYIIDRYPEAT